MTRRALLLETCEDRILCSATPNVTVQAPANAKIGDTVTVKASFNNASASETGYAPYIDLLIDKTGADGNDGLSFANANYLGANVTSTVLTFNAAGKATHPYAKDSAGNALVISAPAGYGVGDQLVVLQLPFGSFTPQQPAATVDINLTVSNLADANTLLPLSARGGFQYGNDPLNNPTVDPTIVQATYANASINPTLFTLKKTYLGPEDETATGRNYLRQYQIDVDIAAGQTITALQLQDLLPSNLQFFTDASHPVEVLKGTTVLTAVDFTATSTPGTTTTGGTLIRTVNTVTGDATTAADATLRFWFYVPKTTTAGAEIINANTGDDATALNNASTSGSWKPLDTRDAQTTVTLDPAGPEHTLAPKSIATQKTVAIVNDAGVAGLSPGDVLEYTVQIQVSDYFAFDNLVLTDLLSDGQHLDQSFTPTFTFTEHGSTAAATGFNSGNWTAAQNYTGAVANGPVYTLNPAANDGTTSISFRLSDEMVTRLYNDDLVGGAIPNGGTSSGNTTTYGATTATVKFRVIVQDTYSDVASSPQLSPRDTLTNAVDINGRLLNITNLAPKATTESDTSGTSLTVAQPALTKTLYAINGALVNGSTPLIIRPGDKVTYRLQYTIPTGDINNFTLTDFLPLPVFDTDNFDLTYSSAAPGTTAPAANVLTRGPGDTFTAITGLTPTITEPGGNSVAFSYGSYSNTGNTTLTADLLFTVVVETTPFADNLFLTNQARATEGIARTGITNTDAIVQFTLGEPDVSMAKGVVGRNTEGFAFSTTTFTPPSSGSSFSNVIDSLTEFNAIDASDTNNVDGGDIIRYAIVAQNRGRSDAFDVTITDKIVPAFNKPADISGLNLVVRRGSGTLLVSGTDYIATYDNTTGQFTVTLTDNYNVGTGTGGLNQGRVDATGALATDGTNVVVITYDLKLAAGIPAGAKETNTATLANFSNVEGGTDFTVTNPTATANVTTRVPTVTKQIIGTELGHTLSGGGLSAVVGELVTITLTVDVPDGTTLAALLTDTLDAGLAFVGVDSIAFVSSAGGAAANVSYSNAALAAVVSNNGGTVKYDFGTLTNGNDSAATESVVITYKAVVLNIASNQGGTVLGSSGASLSYNTIDQPTGATRTPAAVVAAAPTAKVTVLEPLVNITKGVTVNGAGNTGDADDPVTYTITLKHGSTSSPDAFDLDLTDIIPDEIAIGTTPGSFTVTDSQGLVSTANFTLVGQTLKTVSGGFDFVNFANRVITITVSGKLTTAVSAGQTITNTAAENWTSLDGTLGTRSAFNTASVERTGDSVASPLNDYRQNSSADISIVGTGSKFLISTSEAHTSGNVVVPGEIVRYRLVAQLGEGNSPNVQFLDFLPNGLTYLNDGTTKLALVSNESSFTSSTLAGPGLNVTGASGNVSPTFVLSGSAISTTPWVQGGVTKGTNVLFSLGNLTNSDSDTDGEFVVIEFNAIVSNAPATSDDAGPTPFGGSDAGDVNSNSFQLLVKAAAVATSNSVDVTVAEPNVTVTQTGSKATGDAGDVVTYTITVKNSGAANTATAFDLGLKYLLDNDLAYGSVSFSDPQNRITMSPPVNGAQTELNFQISSLDPNESLVFTITTTVKSSASAGESLINSAALTYSSLPGSGTPATNPTGSSASTAGGSGGERTGAGDATNDYTGTSTINFTVDGPTIDKLDLLQNKYTIGDQVVYFLNVTLPEGNTENLVVNDLLPAGLKPISYKIITTGSAAGTTTSPSVNYNGSLQPTGEILVANGSSGQALNFSLGSITTAGDNVAGNNSFLIQITAAVVDDAAVAVNGATLLNLGQLSYRQPTASVTNDPATGSTQTLADGTNITVTEPKLQIVKSVNDTAPEIGQTLNFTLTISHTGSSTATAFDLLLRDAMPSGLVLLPGSVSVSSGATITGNTSTSAGLKLSLDQLAQGDTITITYQAQVSSSQTYVGATLDNNARLYWESLAEDDASNSALTGTADTSGDRDYGAQFGLVEADSPAVDDPAQDTTRVTVNAHRVEGYVYNDLNGDGALSAGETPISGVMVTISGTDLNNNPVTYDLLTDQNGFYSFGNLPAGTYILTEVQPTGYVDAVETVGTNFGGTASRTQGSDTVSGISVANDGAAAGTGYNFGETSPASVRGVVYIDTNNSGAIDSGESRLGNIHVQLAGTDIYGQAVSLETDTDNNGDYLFSSLRPGVYTLTETQPAGLFDGKETSGMGATAPGSVNNAADSNQISSIQLSAGQISQGNLFGELAAASLSGKVYRDLNNNGLVETGEAGVAGVVVTLTGTDDRNQTVSRTFQTDANGNYFFTGLRPGLYTLSEAQPAGLLDGKETAGGGVLTPGTVVNMVDSNTISSVGLGSGQNGTANNFGELPPSSLEGIVYVDDNLDGVLDLSEIRIAGAQIQLTGTDDRGASVSLNATTAPDGSYSFGNLRPGTYLIAEAQPNGFVDGRDTAGTAGGTVTNPPGDTISAISLPSNTPGTGNNFGEVMPATLQGDVYNDRNNNGLREAGEDGLSGIKIRLAGHDFFGNPVNVVVQTDAGGHYLFGGLAPSDAAGYTASEVAQPAGYLDGRESLGSTGGNVDNANPVDSQAITGIPLGQGVNSVANDFGEIKASSLAGTIYRDLNNNGTADGAGETPVSGVTVLLTGKDDRGQTVARSFVTGSDGTYLFDQLRPSDAAGYTITEMQPAGLLDGKNAVGSQGGSTSNNPPTDVITTVPIVPGTLGTGNDFGELPAASLTGTVYRDDNNDGTQQGSEPGLSGVTITLQGEDDLGNQVELTTTTLGSGSYSFTNLRPGTYTLTETQPGSYLDGKNTVGSLGGATTNNPLSDFISNITLVAGNAGSDYLFGELMSSTLKGQVYVDADNDGLVDAGEVPILGTKVVLSGQDDLGQTVSAVQFTDLNGFYSFEGLRPGTYQISEEQPEDYLDGRNTAGAAGGVTINNPLSDLISAIVLPSNTIAAGYSFGELIPSSLRGQVYLDLNLDGARQTGEAGVPKVFITLTGTDDLGQQVNSTVQTDVNGAYAFLNLRPSTLGYTISETQPANYLDAADQIGTQGGTAGNDVLMTGQFSSGTSGTGNDFLERFATNLGKAIVGTSEVGTVGNQVAIGEVVRYRLTVTVPFGTLRDFQIWEMLPSGLLFLNDGTAAVSLMSADGNSLTSSLVSGASATGNGTPTTLLPDGAISSSPGTNSDGYASGDSVYFKLGDLTNTDKDAAQVETVILEFNARVTDEPANVANVTLSNQFSLRFDTTGDGVADNQPQAGLAPPVVVTVVEPKLQLTKQVDDATPDIGQRVTFTLTLAHTSASTEDAFDLMLRDAMPAGLTLDAGSVRVNGLLVSSASTTGALTLDLDVLELGTTITITYEATVDNTLANVGGKLLNNARLYWDSLPGDEANAVLNNVADSTPDRDYGARPGYVEEASTLDNDPAQDSEALVVNSNIITGTVYRDNDSSGTFSAGDTTLGGVTVLLNGTTISGLNFSSTTLTRPDGGYSFEQIPAGIYTISEVQPVGYVDGLETAGSTNTTFGGIISSLQGSDTILQVTISDQSAKSEGNYNFGETLTSSINGSVYLDDDNDGVRDASETGVAGVPIRVTGTDIYGQNVDSTGVTLANGTYSFTNLRPGTYTDQEDDSFLVPGTYLDGRDTLGNLGGLGQNDQLGSITLPQGKAATDYNFGELRPAAISGSVFVDTDNNHVRDAGEAGIANVTVTLQGTDDLGATVQFQATTLADGSYSFTGLRPGTYRLLETQPVQYADGGEAAGTRGGTVGDDLISNIALQAGQSASGYTFGERLNGLNGHVYVDMDRNGSRGSSESGLGGVGLTLRDGSNNIVSTATTLTDGSFSFSNLLAGNYTVEETQPVGYGSSTSNMLLVSVPAGGSTVADFGETLGSLSGRVYVDADQNGSFSAGESGLAGVRVSLIGTADTGESITRTTTTAMDGSYLFEGLLSGQYTISETQPTGYADGPETVGTAGGTLAAPDSISNIGIVAGVQATEYNFGEVAQVPSGRGGIAGLVYYDRNANGSVEGAEAGVGAVKITLRDSLGNVVGSTTTAPDGSYAFANLLPGSYSVTEQQPAAYGSSTPNTIATINVAANEIVGGRNFGETSGSIAGSVYYDRNNNGQRDAGEQGIAGVSVSLQGTDYEGTQISQTALTDANGDYLFSEVLGGNYRLTEVQPTNVADGKDAVGSAGGLLQNDAVGNIGLGGGINATGYLFGELPAFLSGTVYVDADRDQVHSSVEGGLSGVKVTLLNDQGQTVATTLTATDGSYSFPGLAAGSYSMIQSQPAGYGSSTANTIAVVVPAGGTTGVDFGETVGSLGGRVYLDANGDGLDTTGESGIGGVIVKLTGTNVASQPVTFTTTTAGDGTYLFSGLLAGNYTIQEQQPSFYTDGEDTLGSSGGTNSANDEFTSIGLGGGNDATGYNFGETLASAPGKGSISGTVYVDQNRSQQLEGGEKGLQGVLLNLLDANGVLVAQVQSGPDGSFVFSGVALGTGYRLVEQQPAGYGSSTPDELTNITVSDGTVTGQQNFGEIFGALSGRVYVDSDRSGSDTPGDVGIAGVLVKLSGTDNDGNQVNREVLTGPDGSYLFDDLLAGNYVLKEVQPTEYLDGAETSGTLSSDPIANDAMGNIVVGGGDIGTSYNFGEQGASISGTVYHDRNRDGVQQPGEAGIQNVTLQLVNSQGVVIGSVLTQADGTYVFTDLPLGNYTVLETQPVAYGSSTQDAVAVQLNTANATADFGETLGSLSGKVYLDRNNNGLQEPGEPLLPGVILNLTGITVDGDSVNLVRQTDGLGRYNFDDLPAGTYNLTETQPMTYLDGQLTPGTAGGNSTAPNVISSIGLGAGREETGYLFGERSQVDLVVTKDDGLKTFHPGKTITYTMTLRNAGLQEANGVVVSDQFPNKLLKFVSASNGGVYDPATNTIVWQLGQITGGEEEVVTLTVTARVRSMVPAGAEKVRNVVSVVDDGSAGLDANPLNNTAKDVDRLRAHPDLSITKTDHLSQATVGQQTTYILAGGNAGQQVATGVVVSDQLPAGVRFVSATGGGQLINGKVVWNLGNLAPGQKYQLTVTVVIESAAASTTIINEATITEHFQSFEDPTPEDNEAVDLTSVPALPIPETDFYFGYDSFNNFATQPFLSGAGLDDRGNFDLYRNPTDNYRAALLPLAPVYSGEADPGATLVVAIYNAQGDRIGEQTVMVDAGGNWLASFASATMRDYPASVSIVELPAPYTPLADAGRNLRNFFAPVLNPGQFAFGGQDTTPLDPRATAPLLETLNLANPLSLDTVKYGGELLPSTGAPGGR